MTLRRLAACVLLLPLLAVAARAHTETGAIGGFSSGFLHPLSGPDHILAMVAVGLWGAFLGRPAIWLLPVVFPTVMALGGALGVLGVPIPLVLVEKGIAVSDVLLGLMVACAARPRIEVAAVLVGLFAIFHGYAHGREMPGAASAVAFAAGFVIATGLLHLSGIGLGLLTRWPWGVVAVRATGGVIALAGAGFLFGLL